MANVDWHKGWAESVKVLDVGRDRNASQSLVACGQVVRPIVLACNHSTWRSHAPWQRYIRENYCLICDPGASEKHIETEENGLEEDKRQGGEV